MSYVHNPAKHGTGFISRAYIHKGLAAIADMNGLDFDKVEETFYKYALMEEQQVGGVQKESIKRPPPIDCNIEHVEQVDVKSLKKMKITEMKKLCKTDPKLHKYLELSGQSGAKTMREALTKYFESQNKSDIPLTPNAPIKTPNTNAPRKIKKNKKRQADLSSSSSDEMDGIPPPRSPRSRLVPPQQG